VERSLIEVEDVLNSENVITTAEMKALELNSEYLGVSVGQLMENAGHAVAMEVASRFKPGSKIVFFGGIGRNGGDGMVAARHLSSMGFKVSFILVGRESDLSDENTRRNWKALKAMSWSVEVKALADSSQIEPCSCDVCVDALLGTGVRGVVRQPILEAIKALNRSECFRVAVDIPSGINADTGEVLGEAVNADLTVTFHRSKAGFEAAKKHVGELKVAGIGIPPEAELYAGPGDVELVRKPRPKSSRKGDFGRLLVVGGSETFSGAPTLVALAALRCGVDLAYVAAPEKTAYAISSMSPNLITIKLSGEHLAPENISQMDTWLRKATAVVVGSGLGTHRETVAAVDKIFGQLKNTGTPALFDADALKVIGGKHKSGFQLVLTPHAGEFELLSGKKPPSELKDRIEEVKNLARKMEATVLLKGNVDIISDGSKTKLNFTHNPGMTVGGTGDVLSGIVGGFLAQGFEGFNSSVAGAFVNGLAGDIVYREKGFHMMATDLIDYIPVVLESPTSYRLLEKPKP